MNKTQAGRLLTLAYFLKTRVPPNKFDMGCYETSEYCEPEKISAELMNRRCGTSACAIGWCPIVFPSEFTYYYGSISAIKESVGDSLQDECNFFGLVRGEWGYLFGGDNERTPKQEADVIEEFVLEHGWVYAD